jgi:transcriptional regulator with XRE-family HTH domain
MNPIKQLRKKYGITQTALAKAAETSQPTIAAYEAETKSPSFKTIERLANSMGSDVLINFLPKMTNVDIRSLAYHKMIAKKVEANPVLLSKVRKNLRLMQKQNPHAKKLLSLWDAWLKLDIKILIECFLDPNLLARDMRQVTPFAGILSQEERFEILNDLRGSKQHES